MCLDITSYLFGKKSSGGSGGLDWTALGFDGAPHSMIDDYNYSAQIQSAFVPAEDLSNKYKNDTKMIYVPAIDTSTAENMRYMFAYCSNINSVAPINTSNVYNFKSMFDSCGKLRDVPIFDLSSVTYWGNLNWMFHDCNSLTDESLDNILQSCISATSVSDTKTLVNMGISSSYYSASRIQALPHYQDFIDAGWTIGY